MKKLVLALALAGFVGAGMATPALACEGGVCKMEHAGKDSKSKKSRKGDKAESCHMIAEAASTKDGKASASAKSCCAKKDKAAKEIKK